MPLDDNDIQLVQSETPKELGTRKGFQNLEGTLIRLRHADAKGFTAAVEAVRNKIINLWGTEGEEEFSDVLLEGDRNKIKTAVEKKMWDGTILRAIIKAIEDRIEKKIEKKHRETDWRKSFKLMKTTLETEDPAEAVAKALKTEEGKAALQRLEHLCAERGVRLDKDFIPSDDVKFCFSCQDKEGASIISKELVKLQKALRTLMPEGWEVKIAEKGSGRIDKNTHSKGIEIRREKAE
ncbi:MAG: hypothetical protein ABIH35_02770 [Patescibacteria group bacterium]